MRILLRWRANDIPAILYIFVSENRKTSGQCQFLPSSTVFTLHKLSLSPENKKIGCAEKTEQTGQPENLVLVEFRTGVTMICLVDRWLSFVHSFKISPNTIIIVQQIRKLLFGLLTVIMVYFIFNKSILLTDGFLKTDKYKDVSQWLFKRFMMSN